jgi:hypothetical protein
VIAVYGLQPTHSIPSSKRNAIENALRKSLSSKDHPALALGLENWRDEAALACILAWGKLTSHFLGRLFLSS